MPRTTKSRRTAAVGEMRAKHNAELTKAIKALTRANVPADVRHALTCIGGRELPLALPTGANLPFREDVARYCAQRIERRIADEVEQRFIAFGFASAGWACPAHRPSLQLKQMRGVLKRFQRALPNLVYAPSIRLRAETSGLIELTPVGRIFALVDSSDAETVERSVAGICRELDPRNAEGAIAAKVQPIVPSTVAQELTRMLTLGSTARASAGSASSASNSACLGALIRITIAATMPYKLVASGSGTMKADVRRAMLRAKAAAEAREGDAPSPIRKSELYPALGDMMPDVNGQRMRLPFCLV